MSVKKVNSNGVSCDRNVVFIEAPSTTLEPDLAEDHQLVRRQLPLGERLPLPRRCVSCATHGEHISPNRRARADGRIKPCGDRGLSTASTRPASRLLVALEQAEAPGKLHQIFALESFVVGCCTALSTSGFGAELSLERPEEKLFNARWMSTVTGTSTKSINLDL